ncbi:putative beta-lysine N-acetyltransferase [Metabacillus herbersteinensis]|uniref:Beta-lysine N-acetyltransferase n=1 Tax=Metabacillus herbersteinensis TaxID=283816 RepID=A0ABV6GKX6_9BACI
MTKIYSEKVTFKGKNYIATGISDFHNERLKIEEYRGNVQSLLDNVLLLAHDKKLTKIIVKTKYGDQFFLLNNGYVLEGIITHYISGEDVYLYAKYLTENRKTTTSWIQEDLMISQITVEPVLKEIPTFPKQFQIRKAVEKDAHSMSYFYEQIFKVYPTPLTNPGFLKETMNEGTIYYLVEFEKKIISAASAEINSVFHNAEITDCATLPQFRKHQLMKHLIFSLEAELIQKGIYCAYSIARSASYGMNAVLHQMNYLYTGRLTNNCYIYQTIENMNVWCKNLSVSAR